MARVRVEFTVEPFADAAPGPHVLAALDAARRRGLEPDLGPFASTVEVDSADLAAALGDIVDAAIAHGASRVAVQVELVEERAP